MPKKIQQLFTLKSMAHDHIQKQKYNEAIIYFKDILLNFQQSIGQLTTQSEMEKAIKELKIASHKNLSLCYLKIELYKHCVEECLKVFQFQPNNIKILYRIGRSYIELKEYDEAQKYLKKGFFLNSQQKEIMKALEEVQFRRRQAVIAYQKEGKRPIYIVQIIKYILVVLWTRFFMLFGKRQSEQANQQKKNQKHKRK